MKRKLLFLIICLFFITSCNSNRYIGVVNVLNWSSYIPNDVISEFEEKYHIKVNYGTYSSNEELLAKIVSSKEGTYDLIFPSDYMVDLLIKRDLIKELDKSQIHNINNINEFFLKQSYDKDNTYSLPFLLATTVIAVNTNNIKDKITTYNDLLKKEYKNNIVLLDDQRIVIGAALQSYGYDMNDTLDGHLNDAYDYLIKLKGNVKAFDSDSPKTFLITNEVDIGVVWNAEAILAKERNSNIDIIYPQDGYALSMDNYVILKGSKNERFAYLFIDYLLSDEICQRIIDEYPYISTNRNITNLTNEEIITILANGSYIKNHDQDGKDIKKLDKLWARIK